MAQKSGGHDLKSQLPASQYSYLAWTSSHSPYMSIATSVLGSSDYSQIILFEQKI